MADLLERIRTGELLAGARLPSEAELCEAYGVARAPSVAPCTNTKAQGTFTLSTESGGSSARQPDSGRLGGYSHAVGQVGSRLAEWLPAQGEAGPTAAETCIRWGF